MGESSASSSAPDRGIQLTPGLPRLCSCGCGGQATKSSGYKWAYVHDPGVPEADRLAARQLGGRRGAMTAAEVTRLLDGAELSTTEGRNALRDRFLRLRLAGRIGTGVYRDLLVAVDGAGKDREQSPKARPAAPLIVEVARFAENGTQNGHEAHGEVSDDAGKG